MIFNYNSIPRNYKKIFWESTHEYLVNMSLFQFLFLLRFLLLHVYSCVNELGDALCHCLVSTFGEPFYFEVSLLVCLHGTLHILPFFCSHLSHTDVSHFSLVYLSPLPCVFTSVCSWVSLSVCDFVYGCVLIVRPSMFSNCIFVTFLYPTPSPPLFSTFGSCLCLLWL